MPIQLPDLDNIDYDGLMAEAIGALPGYRSDWTDYNPSDPGITVLEMLAWLTEMLVYRTDRIQPSSYRAFLQLLSGYHEAGQMPPHVHFEGEPRQVMREMLLALRRRYRAVTAADYEQLALTTFPDTQPEDQQIERVTCLPEVDVTDINSGSPAPLPGAISLVVLPKSPPTADPWVPPSSTLLDALSGFFEERRLVTTQVRTAGPRYTELEVAATLFIDGDAGPQKVLLAAHRALFEYLHPARGGADHEGWPFGRTVRSTDLTARLADLAGVAFVEDVSVTSGSSGDGESVLLDDDQLPQLSWTDIGLRAKVLRGQLGRYGSDWDEWNPEVTVR